jgi:alpha-beta hydrolase superfamily lysophospholipase
MTVMTAATLLDRAANWQFDSLPLHDGWRLRWAFWQAAQPVKGHVLMLPGLGEVIEKRTLRAAEWAERGIRQSALIGAGRGDRVGLFQASRVYQRA